MMETDWLADCRQRLHDLRQYAPGRVTNSSLGHSNKPTYCQAAYYQPTKDLQCYKHPSYVTTKLQCTQDQQATMTITCQT